MLYWIPSILITIILQTWTGSVILVLPDFSYDKTPIFLPLTVASWFPSASKKYLTFHSSPTTSPSFLGQIKTELKDDFLYSNFLNPTCVRLFLCIALILYKSIIHFCLGPCDLQWCTRGSILPLLIPLGLSYLLWPIEYEQTWCKPCFSRYLELLYGWLLLSFPLFSENHVLNREGFLSCVLEWENSWSKSMLADPQPLTYNVSRNKCVLL